MISSARLALYTEAKLWEACSIFHPSHLQPHFSLTNMVSLTPAFVIILASLVAANPLPAPPFGRSSSSSLADGPNSAKVGHKVIIQAFRTSQNFVLLGSEQSLYEVALDAATSRTSCPAFARPTWTGHLAVSQESGSERNSAE